MSHHAPQPRRRRTVAQPPLDAPRRSPRQQRQPMNAYPQHEYRTHDSRYAPRKHVQNERHYREEFPPQETFLSDKQLREHTKGKGQSHDILQILKETIIIALITGLGIGILSWIVDRIGIKFFSPEYEPAQLSLYGLSAGFACAAVIIFTLLFLGMDKATGISTGLYVALLCVILLGSAAYVLLTSVSLNAAVYMVLFIGLLIPLSYVPGNVKANRHIN